jgi:hypothetical protein
VNDIILTGLSILRWLRSRANPAERAAALKPAVTWRSDPYSKIRRVIERSHAADPFCPTVGSVLSRAQDEIGIKTRHIQVAAVVLSLFLSVPGFMLANSVPENYVTVFETPEAFFVVANPVGWVTLVWFFVGQPVWSRAVIEEVGRVVQKPAVVRPSLVVPIVADVLYFIFAPVVSGLFIVWAEADDKPLWWSYYWQTEFLLLVVLIPVFYILYCCAVRSVFTTWCIVVWLWNAQLNVFPKQDDEAEGLEALVHHFRWAGVGVLGLGIYGGVLLSADILEGHELAEFNPVGLIMASLYVLLAPTFFLGPLLAGHRALVRSKKQAFQPVLKRLEAWPVPSEPDQLAQMATYLRDYELVRKAIPEWPIESLGGRFQSLTLTTAWLADLAALLAILA